MDYRTKKPPGLMIWNEDMRLLIDLPDEQIGRIMKALFTFRTTGNIEQLPNALENNVFLQMADKARRDEQMYVQSNQSRSEKKKEWWAEQKKVRRP